MKTTRRFKNRNDGFNNAQHVWACEKCRKQYFVKPGKKELCHCGGQVFLHFASQAEASRYATLALLQKYGKIQDLRTQVSFLIHVTTPEGFIEPVAKYLADFRYLENGKTVVEDLKGTSNGKAMDPVFLLKKKLVEAEYGIEIQIVTG